MKHENKQHIESNESMKNESGNVLFLILIAVALFAALSYAVTSSSRGGGDDASSETNLINSSTITQYPAGVRTTILRMQISDGITPSELEFNPPSAFNDCQTVGGVVGVNCVFHPDGGGAIFSQGPADVMVSGTQTSWAFNSENQIQDIGRSSGANATASATTADIIAFLVGIREGVCARINTELGISGIPVETTTITVTNGMVNADGSTPPGIAASGTGPTIGSDITALDGQPYGCFQNGTSGPYVYYHALIEQ